MSDLCYSASYGLPHPMLRTSGVSIPSGSLGVLVLAIRRNEKTSGLTFLSNVIFLLFTASGVSGPSVKGTPLCRGPQLKESLFK